MKTKFCSIIVYFILLIPVFHNVRAQNPIIRDQFTADPSARVFGDSIFVYSSHDILATEDHGRIGWFCMEDYHVFSSTNQVDWTDHGVIVSQDQVPWVKPTSYSMWAPDCIYRDRKYFFYFPSIARDTTYGRGFSIGVAISEKPYGPFIPQSEPIKDLHGIDPNPFIDKDGQAYLYWAMRKIFVAKLNDNMLELESEPQVIEGLPEKGLKEGPFLFERKGKYYLTYPHVENKTERLEYALSYNPMGPFTVTGVIMDELPSGCWTNHQSIIEFGNQWYLFYHDSDLSPAFDKNRSIRIDSLFFNEDGTIRKVTPTLRGVGITPATEKIEIDRFSLKSDTGVIVTFLDSLNAFDGWKTILKERNSWIQYNAVNFTDRKIKSVVIKALTEKDSKLVIRLDKMDGPVVSEVQVHANESWTRINGKVLKFHPGIHNLIIILEDGGPVEIDWLRFE
jgi:hypothetical protein